ncbi:general transcription factor 3C polypeptide 3-like [Ylistrum balloti]|uniref:general transcription factor 3C polypeptide 3-like n=1 Tax=Ylistrum balloti TaxID=509963 RepID=UPI002905A052|nr:general transcription factor 3C polypeptide 3-like [Ylistrum balloti]
MAAEGNSDVQNIVYFVESSDNPFDNVGKEITEENWMAWSETGGLVEVHYDETEHTTDEVSTNLDLLASLSMSEEAVPSTSRIMEVSSESGSKTVELIIPPATVLNESQPLPSQKLPPNDLVMLYLSGKISFLEFSEMVNTSKDKDEVEKDDDVDDGDEYDEDDDEDEMEDDKNIDPDYQPNRNSLQSGKRVEESQTSDDSASPVKKKRKYVKRNSKRLIPKHLKGLMGEANLKFARGENEEAIQICMDIIKEAPRAVLPFQTLAVIYETTGDMQKALEFHTLAAYLNPKDSEQWGRLAEMFLDQNQTSQAVVAYSQAIRHDPKNPQYIMERIKLYEELGETKKVMEGYRAMLNVIPTEEGDQYIELARNLSMQYFNIGDKQNAIKIMKGAFQIHPDKVTSEDVNLLLELLIAEKLFLECVEMLVKHCGVSLIFNNKMVWEKNRIDAVDAEALLDGRLAIETCKIPELLPIDLGVKLSVCMIHQHQKAIVSPIISQLTAESIDDMGDLYIDIAEALIESRYYKDAKPLLVKLVKSTRYHTAAAVWLKMAECLNNLGELEEAVKAYGNVVEMAPQHVGARMALSSLNQQLGKHEEAIMALSQDDVGEAIMSKQEQILLLQKCHLLHSQSRHDEFILACKQLLFHQFKDITKASFLKVVFTYKTPKHKKEDVMKHLKEGCQVQADRNGIYKTDLPVDDLWDLFVKLCDLLMDLEKYTELMEVTGIAMSCPFFMADPRKLKQAEFMCLVACIMTKNGLMAFTFVREMCQKEGDKNQVWNLLNQVMTLSTENKYNKFCLRYLLSHPDHPPICLLNGHNATLSGTYKYALGEYVSVLRTCPKEPLVSLCIGLTFIHLAAQKFSAKKHFLLTQGLVFLHNYAELRGDCQESNFNIGRALHQLGLTYAAIHYYRKVLDMKPVLEHPDGILDLTYEAAYNLSLIYQTSNSYDLAALLINKYLVI